MPRNRRPSAGHGPLAQARAEHDPSQSALARSQRPRSFCFIKFTKHLAADQRENGNILLLGLGVGIVALILVFGLVSVGNVYLEHKKLGYLADGAALVYSDVETSNAYFERIERAAGAAPVKRKTPEQKAAAFVDEIAPQLSLKGTAITGVVPGEDGDYLELSFRSRIRVFSATNDSQNSGTHLFARAKATNKSPGQ